jgi:Arc/MetJ family transcription regulator
LDILGSMKTTVDVDRALADEAAEILGTKSLKDTINVALFQVLRTEGLRELAEAVRNGTLAVPTPEEYRKLREPRLPVGALDAVSLVPKSGRHRSA